MERNQGVGARPVETQLARSVRGRRPARRSYFEGGCFSDFCRRVQRAMTVIAAEVNGGSAVVVTHAGVIRTFLGSMMHLPNATFDPRDCDYVSCWEVSWDGKQWQLQDGVATPPTGSGREAGTRLAKAGIIS